MGLVEVELVSFTEDGWDGNADVNQTKPSPVVTVSYCLCSRCETIEYRLSCLLRKDPILSSQQNTLIQSGETPENSNQGREIGKQA